MNKRAQAEKRRRCLELTDEAPSPPHMPRFDLVRSHQLYQALFNSIKDLTGGKELLIVPSGPLTELPFEVMLTEAPESAGNRTDAYREASWLGVEQAITVLPSVSSLAVLRKRGGKSKATRPFAGFGNPLLDGNGDGDPRAGAARERQQCRPPSKKQGGLRAVNPVALEAPTGTFFNGSIADPEALRRQTPLPETADELCTVARNLGAGSELWLGSRMTERAIKALSASRQLQDYRILHFATHGTFVAEKPLASGLLMSGDDENDGTLTVGELYDLHLPVDLVTLSACETALGKVANGDDVVGFTRGFLYAGVSSIVSSLWKVDDQATSILMQQFYRSLKENDKRSALRTAQLKVKNTYNSHPYFWAAFQITGSVQ